MVPQFPCCKTGLTLVVTIMRIKWSHSGQVLAITHSTGKEARCQNYIYLFPTFSGRENVKSELEFYLKHNSEAEV